LKFCLAWPQSRRLVLCFFSCTLASSSLTGCSAPSPEDHFASAQAYMADGHEDAAIIELRNALKNKSSFVEARAQLADLLFASGDFRAADADYGRALEALAIANTRGVPLDAALRRRLTHAQWLSKIRSQQAAEVISTLSRGSGSRRKSSANSKLQPDELALLGHARLALDDTELARQEFASAIAGDDQLSLAHYGRALVAWRSGDLPLAETSFRRAVELDTRDPQLLLDKADFELSQGEYAAARNSFALVEALPGNDLAANLGLVRVQIIEEDYAAASAALDSLLSVNPRLMPAVYLRGLVAYKQGELDEAQLYMRTVLSDKADYPQALYLLGAVQFQKKNFSQAESNLATYVSDKSADASGRKLLAAVRMQTGSYEGVISALSPLAASSSDAQTLAMLGTAHARMGQLNEASEYLDRAVTLAPDVRELRNQLAVTLLAAGNSAQAIGQLESAIELDSELQLSDYLMVLAQLRNGDVTEALSTAQALRARAPEDPMGENLIGAVRFAQGDVLAARASFESALEKDASFQPAVLNLVRLELAEGNRDKAFAVLQDLLAIDANNERALLKLAELELASSALGETGQGVDSDARAESVARAKEHLRQAAVAHPESLAPVLALARLGLFESDTAVALAESAKAMQLTPDNASVIALRIDSLLLAGDSREANLALDVLSKKLRGPGAKNYRQLEGDVGEARSKLTLMDESARSSSLYRLLKADVESAEGDIDSARSGYEALLAEGSRQALFRLVALHDRSGTPQQADELLASWISTHPKDTDAEVVLGTHLLGRGEFSQARLRFESSLAAAPNNVVVLNNLAWLYQQTGDVRAPQTAERAWSLAPENADVADTYGWILVNSGKLKLGSEVLLKAYGLAPKNLSIAYHTASALSETGRSRRALAILKPFGLQEEAQEEAQEASAAYAGSADRAAALALFRKLVAVKDIEAEAEKVDKLIE